MSPTSTPIREPTNTTPARRPRFARDTRAKPLPARRTAYERSRDALRLAPYSPVRHRR